MEHWDTVRACLLLWQAWFVFQQAAHIKAGDKNALSGISTSVLQLTVHCRDHKVIELRSLTGIKGDVQTGG